MTHARRSLTPLLAIAAGLVGAPSLWFAQMAASETLASTACYPLGVAQLAAACAAWIARVWRRPDEPDIRAATRDDSTRFLVRCAVLAALGFVVGLVFTGIVTGFVGPCSPWR
ncbi:cytochrome C oxidase subunit I [Burkholderia multivorans]|uniref:cytochrome C oxidase subunit I n=1 Tax=Burkholderia multivorans TaxID=87883 RepID=UPI0021BECFE2|nr:cytochrome C oxidase subunit I [Burkholderia multivorans]